MENINMILDKNNRNSWNVSYFGFTALQNENLRIIINLIQVRIINGSWNQQIKVWGIKKYSLRDSPYVMLINNRRGKWGIFHWWELTDVHYLNKLIEVML